MKKKKNIQQKSLASQAKPNNDISALLDSMAVQESSLKLSTTPIKTSNNRFFNNKSDNSEKINKPIKAKSFFRFAILVSIAILFVLMIVVMIRNELLGEISYLKSQLQQSDTPSNLSKQAIKIGNEPFIAS